jgi:hypothetical protein
MFIWKILELFASNNELVAVRYLISGTDRTVTVSSEGKHIFSDGIVNKPFDQIVESDIVQWLEKDTTQDEVNAIKLNIENQLKVLENLQKVDFPWLAGTFTI